MSEQTQRQFFRFMNRFMILMWRLGMGPLINIWPQVIGRIMVISHTGRKTGMRRHTPLNYAIMEEGVYCAAGFGARSDWYRNIIAHPQVELWLPQGWWAGEAVPADDDPRRLEKIRQILINSGFAAGLFEGIHPRRMSDLELETLAKKYCLVCIRPIEARTGAGGPSDMVWVWPALAHAALVIWLVKRIGKKNTGNRRL